MITINLPQMITVILLAFGLGLQVAMLINMLAQK